MLTPSQVKLLTPPRIEILKWLVQQRFGTSRQIWRELQPYKAYHHTLGDLSKLRQLGLVKSFRYQPEKGGGSELCWLLLRGGAEAVGVNYTSQYQKEPERQQIEFREMELRLSSAVLLAGYNILKPESYHREHPVPEKTPQYLLLVETLKARVRNRGIEPVNTKLTEGSRLNRGVNRSNRLPVSPKKANDYVAYRLELGLAVVIILAPFEVGEKYWKSRIEQYRGVIQDGFPVIAAFGTEPQAMAWRDLLKKNEIKLTTIDKVEALLSSLRRTSV